jgi:hypothetical protein
MNPTWKAVAGVVLIFILGWFGGALSTLIITRQKMQVLVRNPQAMTMLLIRQTSRGLDLNDSQKSQFRTLLMQNVKERMHLQMEIQPQVWAFNRQTVQEVDALLTPNQQQKFQDNLLLFEARFGRNPLNTGPEETGAATVGVPATNSVIGAPPK